MEFADEEAFWVFFLPEGEAVLAKVVTVVLQQLLKAGPGDAVKFEFGFLGRAGGSAAFDNVLFAAAGCLRHLVDGPRPGIQILPAEKDRVVVDNLRENVAPKFFIARVRPDYGAVTVCHGCFHGI